MRTYGEFVDAVRTTEDTTGRVHMEDWAKLVSEEQWRELKPKPLTKELVRGLAHDMAADYRSYIDTISGYDNDAWVASVVKRGHDFLREIHAKAVEFGIDVTIDEIDQPLTFCERLVASGAAKIVSAP